MTLLGAPIAGLLGAASALWLPAGTFFRPRSSGPHRPVPRGALDGTGLPVLSFGRHASTIDGMDEITIHGTHVPELDAQLSELLYAFNRAATGVDYGKMLNARIDDDEGNLVAAISGFTWGGTCEIEYLWVTATSRGQGIGTALLRAAEQEARSRGCHQVVLSTHSFQAPLFYETHGYQRLAVITDYPRGHEKVIYIKHLDKTG